MGASKPIVLQSAANPTIRHLVRMRDNRARRKAGRVIVDGWRETRHAVEAGLPLLGLYVAETSADPRQSSDPATRQICLAADSAGQLHWVSESIMQKIAYGQSPRGVVAELEPREQGLSDLQLPADPLVMILDRIEKPGNLGAVFRCADAVGVDAVLLCESGDLWNPNAIRSSQGAVFHVKNARGSQAEIAKCLEAHSMRLLAARVESSNPLWQASLQGAVAILLGSEATGLGDRWQRVSGKPVEGIQIPMSGTVDSLNVSVSAAVILYEAIRQRCPANHCQANH
ncbi:RNA methyltransferase [Rubripirellula sp.]|nr:RNA methyltransferase [Rubripirellula sp.]